MDINTKEFWLTVKIEYRPEENRFICQTSETFKSAWNYKRFEIKQQAQTFLNEKYKFEIGNLIIFMPIDDDNCTNSQKIDVRNDFINYMINKFK
jgi:hypothetical protein